MSFSEAALARRVEEFEPQEPVQFAKDSLAELLEPYKVEGHSLREIYQDDRLGSKELGIKVLQWFQTTSRDERGATNEERVAAAQAAVQPTILDLLPTVGSELQTTLRLFYPVVGSVATKTGLVDAGPTIDFIQDPDIPRIEKERVFEEWSLQATIPKSEEDTEPQELTPEMEFKLQAKQWLDDFIGNWDGQSIHIDPRLLTAVANHIDDPTTRYNFVLTHIMYQPTHDEYPPAFRLRNAHDIDLVKWLEQKFRGYNPDVDLVTGKIRHEKTPKQQAFSDRLDQLFDDYSHDQQKRRR